MTTTEVYDPRTNASHVVRETALSHATFCAILREAFHLVRDRCGLPAVEPRIEHDDHHGNQQLGDAVAIRMSAGDVARAIVLDRLEDVEIEDPAQPRTDLQVLADFITMRDPVAFGVLVLPPGAYYAANAVAPGRAFAVRGVHAYDLVTNRWRTQVAALFGGSK